MLILRKDVKLGLGIGCGMLAIGAVYAGISLLTSGAPKVAGDGSPEITTVAISPGNKALSGSETETTPKTTTMLQPGAPAPVPPKVESTVMAGGTVDPFAESNRTDGDNKAAAQWEPLLNSGKVDTDKTTITDIARSETPTSPVARNDTHGLLVDSHQPTDIAPLVSNTRRAPENQQIGRGAVASAGKYIVQPGDTFSSIAAKMYGSKNLYHVLVKANPTIEPTRLKPNMEINVPSSDSVRAERGSVSLQSEAETIIDANRQYRIQTGDTLHGIALRLYGKSAMWSSIYDANKEKIGPDAGRIKVGMVLTLPTPAAH